MTDRDTSDRPDDPGLNRRTDSKSPTGGFLSATRGQAGGSGRLVLLGFTVAGLFIGAPLLVSLVRGGGIQEAVDFLVGLVTRALGFVGDLIAFIPNFLFGLTGGVLLGVTLVFLVLSIYLASVFGGFWSDDDSDGDSGGGSSIVPWDQAQAVLAALGVFAAWWFRDLIRQNLVLIGALGGVVLLYFVLSIFFEESRERRNTSTAVSRTSSRVSDSVEELSATVVGSALVILSAATAAISGGFEAVGTLDQFIAPLLEELGFAAVTLVGYVQLGGNLPFSGFIPSMNAGQWLGFSLVIGALVLVFREN